MKRLSEELSDSRGARVWNQDRNLDQHIGMPTKTQTQRILTNLKPFEVGQIRRGRYDPSVGLQSLVGLQSGFEL